ncbi:MAG TPA: LuxR C-terminal-related transcriptional regulator [Candidatus Tectomicrobia bacterium]|nr:LuxR C-terminal-related transcriptional regulator [Candidatus Tectomicrobia bacterium]
MKQGRVDDSRRRRHGERTESSAAAAIARGRQALARADWNAARAAFEDALRRQETPEALEGLAEAAWWLNDDATVLQARDRAYRSYRSRGDRRGAGRVAISLATDAFHLRGAPAIARGWHARAHRLLDGLQPIPEQGWLRVWEGDVALTLGEDPERVRRLAGDAARLGAALRDVDLEMTAVALEGLALVIAGALSQGLPRLDEATTAVVSGDMGSPLAIGLSSCYLVTACERVRDFDRAAQWCDHIREFCARTRFELLLVVCRIQYAAVLAWRGAWAEAERELQAAARHFGPARPLVHQEAIVRLADLRRQQGRSEEAAALLKEVDRHPASLLVHAALALDGAQPAVAAHLAQRFLRRVPASNRTDRVAALDVLLRAQVALGRGTEASATLAALRAIAEAVPTDAITATALVADGLIAKAAGDHVHARDAFEDAIDRLARSGASLELARCRVELARALGAVGERARADAVLREALQAFQRLGAVRDSEAATALRRDLTVDRPRSNRQPSRATLTPREVEVVRLLAQGLSNRAIGARLKLSPFTVKRHVANVLAKLDVPSRAAAVARAAHDALL